MSYHYIEDKEFKRRLYRDGSDVINRLVQTINNDDVMFVKQHLVGSGAKKLITQNSKESVDLDFNLEIIELYEYKWNDGKNIKNYVMKKWNEILVNLDWGYCKDSTSVLTSPKRYYPDISNSTFSIDIAIVIEDGGSWYRLIHQKTGFVQYDQWYWNEAPHSNDLTKKANLIKKNFLWQEVRDVYLDKKNYYLRNQDYYHPSFICYIEAVNEVYNKYFD